MASGSDDWTALKREVADLVDDWLIWIEDNAEAVVNRAEERYKELCEEARRSPRMKKLYAKAWSRLHRIHKDQAIIKHCPHCKSYWAGRRVSWFG